MIRAVATPAPDTFNRIRDLYGKVKEQFETDLASVGIEVDRKMVKGKFRITLLTPERTFSDKRAKET